MGRMERTMVGMRGRELSLLRIVRRLDVMEDSSTSLHSNMSRK